jgi:hypothetical protein
MQLGREQVRNANNGGEAIASIGPVQLLALGLLLGTNPVVKLLDHCGCLNFEDTRL